MTANEIITIIGNFGFPIFCCLALGYYVKVQTDQYRKDVKDIQKEHKEEIAKVTDALNANTLAISELRGALQNVSKN